MARKALTPRSWTVTFILTDRPSDSEEESYLTKDEIFRYGCSSAGIKVTGLKIEVKNV